MRPGDVLRLSNGVTVMLYDDFEVFAAEAAEGRNAALLITLAGPSDQQTIALMQSLRERFGDRSPQEYAVMKADYYCLSCGHGYSSTAAWLSHEVTKINTSVSTSKGRVSRSRLRPMAACRSCGGQSAAWVYRPPDGGADSRSVLGILFDAAALGPLYGQAAYRILFDAVDPRQLTSCVIADGDTRATMGSARVEYCIAVHAYTPRQTRHVEDAVRGRSDPGLLAPGRRFVTGDAIREEPLVSAGVIDASGNFLVPAGGMVQPHWAEGTTWTVIVDEEVTDAVTNRLPAENIRPRRFRRRPRG